MRSLLICAAIAVGACTPKTATPPIAVNDAWARPADSAGTTAAYLSIVNHEFTSVKLQSASSPQAATVTMHETMAMTGMIHMIPLDTGATIASHDSLHLRQGGKHLMVTGLTRRLAAGDSLPLVLTFSDGRVVNAVAIIRAP